MPEMTDDTAGSKLANSVTLTLVSRAAMIFATVIGLPVAGWMMNRAVDSVDKISSKMESIREQSLETNGNVKLIQLTQGVQTQIIADHEARVRALEGVNRAPRPN